MILGSPTKTENELDHSPIVAHRLSPERPELRSNDHSLHVSEADQTSISDANLPL